MSFFRAIYHGFANYASFSGITSRTQCWFWLLFVSIALCTALVVDGAFLGPVWSAMMGREGVMAFDQDAGQPLSITLLVLFALPTLAIIVRRLHDSELPGWWVLIAFTVIGILPLLYFLIKSGKKGDNRYELTAD